MLNKRVIFQVVCPAEVHELAKLLEVADELSSEVSESFYVEFVEGKFVVFQEMPPLDTRE